MNIPKFIAESRGVFIVAELSANHKQDKQIAIESIKAAKNAGANAIKIQTYTPDTLTIDCKNKYFMIKDGLWKGRSLYDLYKDAYTPWDWHEELFATAREEGLICFSTPFDESSTDFLEALNSPIYKIASFEIHDIPLIKYVASKNKPILISTGIASLSDIDLAVNTCKEVGNNEIVLLKCTSSYPATIGEANLLTLLDLKNRFNVEVGISDHSLENIIPIIATSLGAKVIEKHFILDKKIKSPDGAFSLDYNEFSEMTRAVRSTEIALGKINYSISAEVEKNRFFGRSLFAISDIKEGEKITKTNVKSIRPGYGLHPKYLDSIIGKVVKNDVKRGTPLNWNLIQ